MKPLILELHATPEEVMRAVDVLQDYARSLRLPEKTIFGLGLALEECGSNIVNHALRRDAERTFHLTLDHSDHELRIELRDQGPEFDPTAVAPRKLKAVDDDIPGGWGIHLVRHYMDEIRYQREAGENVLRLIKRLDGAGGANPPNQFAGGQGTSR